MSYKMIIISFAVLLSTAFLAIEGHEIIIFACLYVSHIMLSTLVKEPDVQAVSLYTPLKSLAMDTAMPDSATAVYVR